MKQNRAIQAKAIFLLIVFMTNTILGFACSVGLNAKLKQSHHHETAASFPEITDPRTTSIPHGSPIGKHSHDHHAQEGKDKCCNDLVVKFEKIEKLQAQAVKIIITPVLPATTLSFGDHFEVYAPYSLLPDRKYLVYYHHPPPGRAIRIAIQSFQI